MANLDPWLAAVAARYEIGAILERGACWTFCRATERVDGRAVVLRIVEDERLGQDANAQRFLAEARLVAAAEHPRLIPLLDAGVTGTVGWVASATTTGTSLREVLSRGRLKPEEAAIAGEQIAAALDAVHAKGVIHRDLRAEQVVQVAPGAFRLGGFGVGRWIMAGARRLDGTPVAGLPAVLSPELLTAGAATVATDIHALGLLLFEMLTGQHPFAAPDTADLLEKLARSYALPPSTLAERIPAPLEEVVLRALAKDPSGRYFTAAAMQQALAACPGAPGAPTEPARKRRTIPTWAEMLSASRGVSYRMKRAVLMVTPLVVVGAVLFALLRNRAPAPNEDVMVRAERELRLRPADVALRLQFGEQLERLGRVDEARRLFDDALRLDPRHARAIAALARLHERVGRRDEARRTYRRAIEADPRAWFAVLELARLLQRDGRNNEARVLLEQGLAASPGQPDLTETLGNGDAVHAR